MTLPSSTTSSGTTPVTTPPCASSGATDDDARSRSRRKRRAGAGAGAKERRAPAAGEKVYIQRDFSRGGRPVQFQTRIPEELKGRIDDASFERTVEGINSRYALAEEPGCATWCEGFVGCLTAYTVFLCCDTNYERVLRKVRLYVEQQNERVWNPRGMHITDPALRGLRLIEITILED